MTPDPSPVANSPPSDRYVIERELGRGGMATVYLARDTRHDRAVALKVLRPEFAAGLGAERFLREIRVTARLQHAHILPLLDSGVLETQPGRSLPYYVMPYVEGETLRERLGREGPLPVDEAMRMAAEVAGALAYAHEHGVIHRDVKPANILLSGKQAIVADFGIARAVSLAGGERITETGLALGTPHYMSPEQITGDRAIDARADVYALGCVLYEMLAGEPPFTGPTAQAIAAKSLVDPAPSIRKSRPAVPEAIERIIARALAKLPADRFAGAADFAEALSLAAVGCGTDAPSASGAARRFGWAGAATILVLGAVGVVLLRRGGSRPDIIVPASSIAVLPFTPSTTDSALSRLGRDLVFTMSAELDGLGGIHVVDAHTVLARTRAEELPAGTELPALARALGAGSLVKGSVVRVGGDVRLDLALVAADSSARPLARATVTAPLDSIAVFTDSATRTLLVQIWSQGSPPTPSLDAALRTHSVPALRAFLQGEGELVQDNWEQAAMAYQHAMDADPTFWLAYARYVFARYWSLQEPSHSVVTLLERHRAELPERERLTTEAILLQEHDSLARSLVQARAAGERYPDSWFGWLIDGDATLHYGPILGHTVEEARMAFERALMLNPRLVPAWEHLMLAALLEGDTTLSGQALDALERLNAGPSLTADGFGNRMLQYRYLRSIQRGDSATADALTDSIARDAATAPGAIPDGTFYDPYRFGWYGRQISMSRLVLTRDSGVEGKRAYGLLLALSWGGRGAWDSALATVDRMGAAAIDTAAAVTAYRLAAAGVWLEALDPDQATARRQAAARSLGDSSTGRAELAWLDGVVAAARRDRAALAEARRALHRSGDSASASLDRSLGAMDAAIRGATRTAGTAMAAVEWEEAGRADQSFSDHPLVIPLNRLAAARWLAASGDGEQALRLLRWIDGPFYLHRSTIYSVMFTGLADLERAHAEERAGHSEVAQYYYRSFVRVYDRPMARHMALIEEAKGRAGGAGRR